MGVARDSFQAKETPSMETQLRCRIVPDNWPREHRLFY